VRTSPGQIPFVKAHGLGNDFLLVEESALAELERSALAMAICDRHTGVGADGIVVLGASASATASFRIYNSDGSEVTLSGNALRCAAAWLLQKRATPARDGEVIALDTRVGVRELAYLRREGPAWILRAEIGKPSFAAADVPFRPPAGRAPADPIVDFALPVSDVTVPVTVLWMGNPQCITFVEDFSTVDWKGLGVEIERHPYFPDRANVGFVRVVDEGRIEARFWERGAGHTLASGTGSCACAVASHLAGRTGRRATVELERGALEVLWRDDGMVELTGPAEITAQGIFYWRDKPT
jgi:diaminopimelate epimerase